MADEPRTYTQEEVEAQLAGIKAKNDELLAAQKKLNAQLKSLEGVDPEEFKSLKAAAEKAEREKLEGQGNWKAMEEQLIKKYSAEIETRDTEAKRLRSALESYLIDAEATRELAAHTDAPSLLLPHVRRQMQVIEQDGQFHARIVDGNGNVRIGKGAGSAPMTLSELMDEMRGSKDYALAFRGTGSTGGGAQKSGAPLAPGTIPADGKAFLANLAGVRDGSVKIAS